jgi:hypothetical protein
VGRRLTSGDPLWSTADSIALEHPDIVAPSALTSPALLSPGERREKSKKPLLLSPSFPVHTLGREGVPESRG